MRLNTSHFLCGFYLVKFLIHLEYPYLPELKLKKRRIPSSSSLQKQICLSKSGKHTVNNKYNTVKNKTVKHDSCNHRGYEN